MQLLVLFLAVLVIGYLATLGWFHLARKWLWLDQPNHRSSHAMPTPTSGGIGFVIAFTICSIVLFLWQQIGLRELVMLSAGIVLAITGFIDDQQNLTIKHRLIIQFAICCFVVIVFEGNPRIIFFEGVQIEGAAVRVLILFGLLWLINLYNFMDGIDGLAVVEAICFALSICLLAFLQGNNHVSIVALGFAVSLCGFFYFNLPPAKIFMGDLGSNYLGLILGVIGILGMVAGIVSIWTILVLLSVFIVDATTTLLARIGQGLVWYHGHNTHAYQCATRRLQSHGRVVGVVCGINIIWLLPLAWMTIRYPDAGLLLVSLAWLPLALLTFYCRKGSTVSAGDQA